MKVKGLLPILIVLCSGLRIANADVVVVTAANSSISSLSREQVINIFLGKYRLVGDVPVKALEVNEGQLKHEFYSTVLLMSEDQYNSYWSRMVFTGKAFPPKEVASFKEAKQKLVLNTSLITYANADAVDSSLKVLYRGGR